MDITHSGYVATPEALLSNVGIFLLASGILDAFMRSVCIVVTACDIGFVYVSYSDDSITGPCRRYLNYLSWCFSNVSGLYPVGL
jgi:hypothetical protein